MRARENNQREYLVFSRKTDSVGNHRSVEINDERCDIENITLKPFGQLYIDGEKHSFPVTLSRLRWAFLSRNEAKIYFVRLKNNEIIHESVVVPQCRKFPFLRKGDYEIGSCFTAEKYRGHGIYPTVLLHIVESVAGGADTVLWMLVAPKNISSIRGIKKAGFKPCGTAWKTAFKKYRMKQNGRRCEKTNE